MKHGAPEFQPWDLRVMRVGARKRQRDVAAHLGVAPQRVSDFETGLRNPTPEQLRKILEFLQSSGNSPSNPGNLRTAEAVIP